MEIRQQAELEVQAAQTGSKLLGHRIRAVAQGERSQQHFAFHHDEAHVLMTQEVTFLLHR